MTIPGRITGSAKKDRPALGQRKPTFRSEYQGEGPVPNAKAPLRRPPDSLRDKLARLSLTQSVLPKYTGPYGVGMMDIELPARNPRIISNEIRRKHRHLLRLETVLFSIYYPTLDTTSDPEPSGRRNWSRETWLPRPRASTARAYGRFAGLGALPPGGRMGEQWEKLAVPFFAGTTMWTKIPALRNANLARVWPDTAGARGETDAESDGKPPKFPVFVFSHGLGGTRTVYSSLCGEFASYGFVVIALEHRDGSGPRTYINHPKDVEYDNVDEDFKRLVDDHPEKERRKGHHKVDYIFPENNRYDTAPSNEKGVDQKLRTAQMQLRLHEIEEAYHVLQLICQGKGDELARVNLRRKGYKASSSRGVNGVNWSLWKDSLRLEDVTILGHSFGAATCIELLRNAERFPYVRQGIIYDIWGAVSQSPENMEEQHLRKPMLALNSEAFTYWPSNFKTIDSLVEETRSEPDPAPAYLLTVRGTIHISQSDFSLVYPKLSSFMLRMTANPRRAVDVNVSATFEFLMKVDEGIKEVTKHTLKDRDEEGFLSGSLIEHVPSNRKPSGAEMAIKLHAPRDEPKSRVVPKLVRSMKPAKQKTWQASDEVWVHSKSDWKDVDEWLAVHGSERQRAELRRAQSAVPDITSTGELVEKLDNTVDV